MAIKDSGSLSMTEIVAEFGGEAPHSLSEYYGVAPSVPSSGAIAFQDFYGASSIIPLLYPTGNYRRVNLADWVTGLGHDPAGAFLITIDAQTTFWSDDITLPALDASGLGSLYLLNNGKIMGKGGDGFSPTANAGFNPFTSTTSPNGMNMANDVQAQNGGPALSMCQGTVTNNGYIAGGGGGGGGVRSMVYHISNKAGYGPTTPSDWLWTGSIYAPGTDYSEFGNYPNFPNNDPNWLVEVVNFNASNAGDATVKNSHGAGGGAGGGQGGRGAGRDNPSSGVIAYPTTDMPPAVTAINQTGTVVFRRRGSLGNFTNDNAGYSTEQPPAPADGGGTVGFGHISSSSTFGGGHTY